MQLDFFKQVHIAAVSKELLIIGQLVSVDLSLISVSLHGIVVMFLNLLFCDERETSKVVFRLCLLEVLEFGHRVPLLGLGFECLFRV